jgi:hypothetical protein
VFNLNVGFVPDTMIIDPELWILSRNNSTAQVLVITPPVNNVFSVGPIPTRGQLTINLPSGSTGIAQIFNALGQRVYQAQLPLNTNRMDISTISWSSGIYWLRISGGNLEEK